MIKPDLVSNVNLKKIAIQLKRFSALFHQNIISNSELSSFQIKEKTYYYYVLDFISGESLEHLLNRCLTIDIKKSCDIVLNIIKAVLFLHDLDEPYIFGNITPNSVFINYEDNGEKALIIPVLVSNFLFDDNKNHQQKISYAYQSNAVLSGEVSIVDDVYAVVTLLYKIITGVFPWNYDFDW